VLELRATPGNSGLRAAAGYYFFRSKRLAARGSIPGWRLDPSGWLLFFFWLLCCGSMPGATYAALIPRGLIPSGSMPGGCLLFFFLAAALQQAARSSRAWLLDPAANFAAASWRQAANRRCYYFFPCCLWLLDTGLELFPRNKKAPTFRWRLSAMKTRLRNRDRSTIRLRRLCSSSQTLCRTLRIWLLYSFSHPSLGVCIYCIA